MIKTLQKVGAEGIDLNIIKALCDKLIRKDPDGGKDWRQEEKRMTEDEMVGWHRLLNGHEFEKLERIPEGGNSETIPKTAFKIHYF